MAEQSAVEWKNDNGTGAQQLTQSNAWAARKLRAMREWA